MQFGVPSKKQVKVEKYPNLPVVTLEAIEKKGESRRLVFNKEAFKVLELNEGEENKVAFSLDPSDLTNNYIINANTFDSGSNLNVKKNGSVSNKRHYEELKSRFKYDEDKDLELLLLKSDKVYDGITLWVLEDLSKHEFERTMEEEVVINEEGLSS